MKTVENLITPLIELTENDKLLWEADHGPNIFSVNLANHSVRVWHWQDDNDTNGVSMQLISSTGNSLDTATADQFSHKYEFYSNLYNAARRSANNVSELINEIENEILLIK